MPRVVKSSRVGAKMQKSEALFGDGHGWHGCKDSEG